MYTSKSVAGRRRWTAKQRQRFLARFHESQLTQRDFANRHGVGLSPLSKWLRVESTTAAPSIKFQEVVLPNGPLQYPVEVVSPHGWIVRLQNDTAVQALSDLLQALPC
jgi:transposase-like protein